MDRKKMSDKALWKRMGRELRFLEQLTGDILCDPDYNDMVDNRTWNILLNVSQKISTLRSKCEDRMFRVAPIIDTGIFYGLALGMEPREALETTRKMLDERQKEKAPTRQ